MRRTWLCVAPAVLLPVLAGCGGVAGTTAGGAGATGARVGEVATGAKVVGSRLWIDDGGRPVPFDNGHTVTIGPLAVEIYVAPYPPGRAATIDFRVTRDSVPVDNADVTLEYDMVVMLHGPFELSAVAAGQGHYQAPVDFIMTGDFLINVSVQTGGTDQVVSMYVRAVR